MLTSQERNLKKWRPRIRTSSSATAALPRLNLRPALAPYRTAASSPTTIDSGNTRRQIGIRKKQLIRQCDAIEQILRDYNVPKQPATPTHLTTEEITAFREELSDAQNQLLQIYTNTEQLHSDWSKAQVSDPKEEEIFQQYVEKYGDYTKIIQRAAGVLGNVDELMNAIDADFVKRRLPIPKKHNDAPKPPYSDDRQQGWTRTNQPQTNLTSAMNFVDAFILSRLDLPSFDGRALHSIEGLTLTISKYYIALDILKTRYDDKLPTRHVLFSQLANSPQCDH
ncbi:hypothetical protein ANCDUO_00924 [Ancylostoma duodenale]|uniref:Uncharacterized protein n=1 Tax=Ancylostoma duodenale TaxID=51022 RepID=A0A0C2DFF8_9BILA|nr:hypothetical protein ANCDUO_00924 [Ancylostoma duodenale]